MLRPIPLFNRLLGLSLLGLLGACAQTSGLYDTPRENTVSDARHRAQGDATAVAPSQLQLGFGDQTQSATQTAAKQASGEVATATQVTADGATTQPPARAVRHDLPAALAETRTYLGTVACAGTAPCTPQRLTLTLAPDGQWRARNAPANGDESTSTATMGCWFLTNTDPARIVLQSGDQAYAGLELIQANVLQILSLNGQTPLLTSRLTRQADLDPITELSSRPAQSCPAD